MNRESQEGDPYEIAITIYDTTCTSKCNEQGKSGRRSIRNSNNYIRYYMYLTSAMNRESQKGDPHEAYQALDFQNKIRLNLIHNQVVQGNDRLHKKEKLIILHW